MLRCVVSEYFPMFRRLAFSLSSGSNVHYWPCRHKSGTIYPTTKRNIAGEFKLYIYVCMCVCVCVCVYIYIYTHMRIYIYIHTCVEVLQIILELYMCIYIYMHINISINVCSNSTQHLWSQSQIFPAKEQLFTDNVRRCISYIFKGLFISILNFIP
jgi:hypothetical protein